ncbi:copper-binding protein [Marinospirillum sp.]|uniref:cupredoxin domain-containing protein n=1 Tax=Marinospirillum sp. TaxID=2183934 RepID=UPI00286FF978|nr:copper-binding protein [Marinospirillum sp.]MDR9468018.1 copper-binding protein [Marinospirillum sp.]
MKDKGTSTYLAAGFFLALWSFTSVVSASPGHGDQQRESMGQPGQPEQVDRSIDIEMHDNYYGVENLDIQAGETIRFQVTNKGKLVHEFSVGTPDMHEGHQEMMQMMVEHGAIKGGQINQQAMQMDMGDGRSMQHDDPNSLLLEAGETGELIWTFNEPVKNLEFACNLPGHYQAGMMGNFHFQQ